MAADVTLVALPNTPGNLRRGRLQTLEDLFPDDEVWRDDDGTIVMITGTDTRGDHAHSIHSECDWFEIGPVSYVKAALFGSDIYLPGPTVAVHLLWNAPRVVTPSLVTQTMVAMNVPDRSQYRHRPRRQHVKRWLNAHTGWIVWAETW